MARLRCARVQSPRSQSATAAQDTVPCLPSARDAAIDADVAKVVVAVGTLFLSRAFGGGLWLATKAFYLENTPNFGEIAAARIGRQQR